MKKRILAILMSLSMMCSMLPTVALAVGEDISVTGDTSQYSWEDNILTIKDGADLTLSGTTITETIVVEENARVNLNLDNISISTEWQVPLTINRGATANLTLNGVTLTGAEGISATNSEVNIALVGENRLNSRMYFSENASLNIAGNGTLKVYVSSNYDAIHFDNDINLKISENATVYAVAGGSGIAGNGGYNIGIEDATVHAIGGAYFPGDDDYNEEDGDFTYPDAWGSYGYGIEVSEGNTAVSRTLHITDSTVETIGTQGGISLPNDGTKAMPSTITIDGDSSFVGYGMASYNRVGLGTSENDDNAGYRNITIGGNSAVTLAKESGNSESDGRFENASMLGGGNNENGSITIKNNAHVRAVSAIGSSVDNAAGGIISILDNAKVGMMTEENVSEPYYGGVIGTASYNTGSILDEGYIGGSKGGDGGTITIDTTGFVVADFIGGGNAELDWETKTAVGGDGGNISIENGDIITNHIGGGSGDASNYEDGTATGGDGGVITISGGSIQQKNQYSDAERSPAFIGGGYGYFENTNTEVITHDGGDGGEINISGGEIEATATHYNDNSLGYDSKQPAIGAAVIGGAYGGDGGTITISGGVITLETAYSYEGFSSYAEAPTLIGGGSKGASGDITITGGYVHLREQYNENDEIYYNLMGHGKGATSANGSIKIEGGSVRFNQAYSSNDVTLNPSPTNGADNAVFPFSISLANAENLPSDYERTFWDYPTSYFALSLTDNEGVAYPYSLDYAADDSDDNNVVIWLPVDWSEISTEANEPTKLFDIALKATANGNTHSFTGEVTANKDERWEEVGDGNWQPTGEITQSTNINFTWTGLTIPGISLTSDFGAVNTYDGADHTPTFLVRDQDEKVLTEGTDYDIKIEWQAPTYHPQAGTWLEVTEIVNHGSYRAVATGKGEYEGFESAIGYNDDSTMHINPKYILVAPSDDDLVITKEYDGDTSVRNADGEVLTNLPMKIVDPSEVAEGDSITNILFTQFDYQDASVGTGKAFSSINSGITYDGDDEQYNYTLTTTKEDGSSTMAGAITVKVLGETNFDASGVTITKDYDGTTDLTLSAVSGTVNLVDLVGQEVAQVGYTAVSNLDSKDVATQNNKATLTIGGLTGANAANYQLANGSNTVDVSNVTINPADYSYTLTAEQSAQEFTQGGGLAQVVIPQIASGVNNETVTGTAKLFIDDEYTTEATDATVNSWGTGTHNLYVQFTPDASETNYSDKVTTGSVVVVTVVEGEPQNLLWDLDTGDSETAPVLNATYGDTANGYTAVNTTENAGTTTYASNDETVVTVGADGTLTVLGVGTATITATAPAIEGVNRETSIAYRVVVTAKELTVTISDKTKQFGDENPAFTATVGSLATGDGEGDLNIQLSTTATKTSVAGEYPITGTYDNENYSITFTEGALTVAKADAPTLAGIAKSAYYAEGKDITIAIEDIPADAGVTTITLVETTDDSNIISAIDGMTITTAIGELDATATITATVEMANYEDAIAIITVKLVDKTQVTISGIAVTDKIYDGQPATYTGTATGNNGYTGELEYNWSSESTDVGTYILTVSVPEADADFMGEATYTVVIRPMDLTIVPENITIYNGASLPTEITLIYTGLVLGDTFDTAPTFTLTDSEGAELADSDTNGVYSITWTNSDEFTDSNYNITSTDTATLTIKSRPSSGSSGITSVQPTPKPEISADDGDATASIPATSTTKGDTTTAKVDEDILIQAVDDVVDAKDETGVANVEIQAEAGKTATKVAVEVSSDGLSHLAESEVKNLTISSRIGTLTISSEAAESISKQAGKNTQVIITVGQVETDKELNAKQQEAIGDAPVFDLSVTVNGKAITHFDGGLITVRLPYELKADENPSGVCVWYMDENGNIENMYGMYDIATGEVVFTTTHFSYYVVGYVPFDDVDATDWFYQAVLWAVDGNITVGTSDTTFSPDESCSRAQAVTFLYRGAGSPQVTGDCVFTDVNADDYYYDAVLWAVSEGITTGTSETTFSPDEMCSRSQIVTFLYRAVGAPEVAGDCVFTDVNGDAYYYDAVLWAVEKGITNGTSDTTFSPDATCTRGQIVTFLYRECEE